MEMKVVAVAGDGAGTHDWDIVSTEAASFHSTTAVEAVAEVEAYVGPSQTVEELADYESCNGSVNYTMSAPVHNPPLERAVEVAEDIVPAANGEAAGIRWRWTLILVIVLRRIETLVSWVVQITTVCGHWSFQTRLSWLERHRKVAKAFTKKEQGQFEGPAEANLSQSTAKSGNMARGKLEPIYPDRPENALQSQKQSCIVV
ncbi:hypothetical protein DFH05DRAFT_1459534 [Lentinula detonsa]|uniref:Uncharacterized protein n=1 Tax=Lentinula detonsa TaxID=2804962 RepID=A0A9W8P2Z0_9AGAR|nr:hypothetical protein DFH05DRAFT_1459534 [Lentinula detonsa]